MKYFNLTALIALLGAGACLVGEISNPQGVDPSAGTPKTVVTAVPSPAAAKPAGRCSACAAQSAPSAAAACPYVKALNARCPACDSERKPAKAGH